MALVCMGKENGEEDKEGTYPPALPSFVFAPQRSGRSAQDVWEGGLLRDGRGDCP